MTKTESLHEDIAYLKDLANAGVSTPLMGGRISIFFGSLYAVLCVFQWSFMTYIHPPGWVYPTVWFGSWVVSWLVWWFMVGRLVRTPGSRTLTNKAAGLAWTGAGMGMLGIFSSAYIIALRLDSNIPYALLPSVIVSLYGSAWFVGGMMSKQTWMIGVCIGCLAYAILMAVLITSPYLWLLFGLGLVLFGVIPGIIQVRREPKPGV